MNQKLHGRSRLKAPLGIRLHFIYEQYFFWLGIFQRNIYNTKSQTQENEESHQTQYLLWV